MFAIVVCTEHSLPVAVRSLLHKLPNILIFSEAYVRKMAVEVLGIADNVTGDIKYQGSLHYYIPYQSHDACIQLCCGSEVTSRVRANANVTCTPDIIWVRGPEWLEKARWPGKPRDHKCQEHHIELIALELVMHRRLLTRRYDFGIVLCHAMERYEHSRWSKVNTVSPWN